MKKIKNEGPEMITFHFKMDAIMLDKLTDLELFQKTESLSETIKRIMLELFPVIEIIQSILPHAGYFSYHNTQLPPQHLALTHRQAISLSSAHFSLSTTFATLLPFHLFPPSPAGPWPLTFVPLLHFPAGFWSLSPGPLFPTFFFSIYYKLFCIHYLTKPHSDWKI
jgi:hypothetical protein